MSESRPPAISATEMAELEELLGGRFPDDYQQSPLSPDAEAWIAATDRQPIATAPCDDRWAWVRWDDGTETIVDLDHDSDPEWWAERGATHWRSASAWELTRMHN